MRIVLALSLAAVLSACGPKHDDWPALTAKCKSRHLRYQMWCYAGRNCYGEIWPESQTFTSNSFRDVEGGKTPEEVVAALIEAADKPLQPTIQNSYETVYETEMP